MNHLCIFVLAIVVLGVSSIPSRKRRQFDWADWENNDNSDWSGSRPTRQRDRWNGGNANGRQLPPNAVGDFDFGQNFIQSPANGFNVVTPGTADSSGSTTTKAPATFTRCVNGCASTTEYNPVCGTDGNTYHNLQRLRCAVNCGANLQLQRGGTCQPL